MTKFREAKNRIDDILRQFEWTDFFEWVDADPIGYGEEGYVDCGINSLYDFLARGEYPDNLAWAAGATRIVIWDTDYCDFVLKIAIDVTDESYNEREEDIYNAAVMRDAEDAFAWCSCIYTPGERGESRGFYAMEFAACDSEEVSSACYSYSFSNYCVEMGLSEDSQEAQDKFYDYYWDMCDDNEEVFEYMSRDWSCRLTDAVRKMLWDFHINDVHSGNIGYIGERTVMTDYAGF